MQHYLVLNGGNFYAKNSIVTKFCHLALGVPVIMPRRRFHLLAAEVDWLSSSRVYSKVVSGSVARQFDRVELITG